MSHLYSKPSTEFYLAFMKTTSMENVQQYIRIATSLELHSFTFTIRDSQGIVHKGHTGGKAYEELDIPDSVMVDMDSDPILSKGWHISSPKPITVHSVLRTNAMGVFSTFLALPEERLDLLEYEYFVITHQAFGSLAFLLVGIEDNTSISITLPFESDFPLDPHSPKNNTISVPARTMYKVMLNRLQTFKYKNTLTSTAFRSKAAVRILSNRPITVIAGDLCQYVHPGHAGQTKLPCAPFLVPVPMVINWGKKFILSPFSNQQRDYKLVAAKDWVAVSLACSNQTRYQWRIILGGHTKAFSVTPDVYCFLESAQPIMTLLLAFQKGTTSSFIIVIPSLDAYSSKFVFKPPNDGKAHYTTVIVTKENFTHQLFYDKQPIPNSLKWTRISNSKDVTVGYGCGFEVDMKEHTLLLQPTDTAVLVTMHGIDSSSAYGFVVGETYAQSKKH